MEDFSPLRGDHPHERPDAPDVRGAVQRISKLVTEHKPAAVVTVLERIAKLVGDAVSSSDRPETPQRVLPFPHFRNPRAQREFAIGLEGVLSEFGCTHAR